MTTTIRPIVLGGDLGAYATARAFHEAFGVRSVVVAGVSTGAVARSAIVDHRIVAGLDQPGTVAATVEEIVAEQSDAWHVVLASADWHVQSLVAVRDRIERPGRVVVPYADAARMASTTDKAAFSRLCTELGIPHPATRVLRVGTVGADDVDLTYPLVVKAASSSELHAVEYPGKHKVDIVEDRDALADLLGRMAAAGFTGEIVVQEYIPGGDDEMGAVNAFCGPDGQVRFLLFGQVLLEEHTPNGRGNSVAQITGGPRAHDEAVGHARRLLEHVGWTGFANLDVKRDPRDGTYRFLELNPRVGRSGYAVTAAGYNVARMYVEAYCPVGRAGTGERGAAEPGERAAAEPGALGAAEPGERDAAVGESEHLFTVVPLALLARYVDAGTRRRIGALRRRGAVTNPYYYRAERDPRRWAYIAVAMANQFRKFARHHRP